MLRIKECWAAVKGGKRILKIWSGFPRDSLSLSLCRSRCLCLGVP